MGTLQNNRLDQSYLSLAEEILSNGISKKDRTGTGTISIFGTVLKHKMDHGFPILTSKKMYIKGIIHELIWFLRGDTNIKYLVDNNVHIWDGDVYKAYLKNGGTLSKEDFIENIKNDVSFSKKHGELGPIYGKQWRDWNGVDQIKNLLSELKNNPDSRRLLVNSWNVGELEKMTLPPCHFAFQCWSYEMNTEERIYEWCKSNGKSPFYGDDITNEFLDEINFPKRKISLKWYQRSVDYCLGLPYNITSYGLLLELIAKEVNMISHELVFSGGDTHIYNNHIEHIKKQMNNQTFILPEIKLKNKSLFTLEYSDIEIINYTSAGKIEMELSN
jgi:thymidylate synthase